MPGRPFDPAGGCHERSRPPGRAGRAGADARIAAGGARRRCGRPVERARLCPGRARAAGRDRGAGGAATTRRRSLHHPYAQRGRACARQPRRKLRRRPRRRGAGRDLAPQDDRAAEFRAHRRDPAGHRRRHRAPGGRARRLSLHRLLDGIERGPGRARLEGAGDLVEERPRAGRARIIGDRRRLGSRHRRRGRPPAAGGCDLLDDGRARCTAGAELPAYDDRLGRAAPRFPPAPAAVGHLSARARPLLPRARPLWPRRGGAQDDRSARRPVRPRRPRDHRRRRLCRHHHLRPGDGDRPRHLRAADDPRRRDRARLCQRPPGMDRGQAQRRAPGPRAAPPAAARRGAVRRRPLAAAADHAGADARGGMR